jgi:signal transduction histidine kinase/CheY-like chemotaxis protein
VDISGKSIQTYYMENKTLQEVIKIKEKLIDLLYWIFIIVMWFALAASLYRTINLGFKALNYIQLFLVLLFLIVFFYRKKLSYTFKSRILLLIIFVIGSVGVISLGLDSQGVYLLMLFTILTSALLGKKWSVFSFIISILTLLISAILFLNNIIPQDLKVINFSQTISAWVMALLVFSIITWIIIIFWQRILNFLMTKVESSLLHEENLNKVNKLLFKEIESRKVAEQLLKEQYEETKKLNTEYQNINAQLQEVNVQLEKSNHFINEAKLKAQAADQLKSSFLSNMSHEIRTPINAIVGFASLIANDDISEKDKKNYLDIIQSSTNGLLNTITDIITIAKIESGQFTLYPGIIDLDAFFNEVIHHYSHEIYIQKGENVKLIIEKNISGNCNVISDMESLSQITFKLIDNAIKFTEKGHIKISVNLAETGYLIFQIEDSGLGIAEKTKTDIFESFRQIDMGNTRQYGGIGIGLAIAKGLIDLLNGTIEFTSTLGKGTRFNYAIPIIQQSKHKESTQQHPKLDTKRKTVLIIGKCTWDNWDINQFLQEIEAVLIYVESGFQAIDACKEHPEIELVIMSIFLPDMNSNEMARILKENNVSLPILAHLPIGKVEPELHQNLENWNGFIESPINKNQLVEIFSKFFADK